MRLTHGFLALYKASVKLTDMDAKTEHDASGDYPSGCYFNISPLSSGTALYFNTASNTGKPCSVKKDQGTGEQVGTICLCDCTHQPPPPPPPPLARFFNATNCNSSMDITIPGGVFMFKSHVTVPVSCNVTLRARHGDSVVLNGGQRTRLFVVKGSLTLAGLTLINTAVKCNLAANTYTELNGGAVLVAQDAKHHHIKQYVMRMHGYASIHGRVRVLYLHAGVQQHTAH